MSYETWEEEFYPVDAEKLRDHTDEECVAHSLQKWKGALPENCEKHELRYQYHELLRIDNASTQNRFNSNTCALCQKYDDNCKKTDKEYDEETFCPIVRFTGESCDNTIAYGESDYECDPSVKDKFSEVYYECSDDPTIMIELLTHTLEFVKRGN